MVQLIDWLYNTDKIIISTDLETDDLIAIEILLKIIPKDKELIFIVGEGNSYIKYMRMKKYIEIFGIKNSIVVQGEDSDKDFPCDGYDVYEKTLIEKFRNCNRIHDTQYEIKKLLDDKKITIFSLKPPRELIKLWFENNDIFKNINLIGYMSFNIRCLKKTYNDTDIINFIKSFNKVIYYETYLAVGDNNTIDNTMSFPFDKLSTVTTRLMESWNNYMLDDAINNISKNINGTYDVFMKKFTERNFEFVKRNFRKLVSIVNSHGCQFVNADCGLIVSMLMELDQSDYTYGDISYNNAGYTVVTNKPDSNILIINPIDKKIFLNKQLEHYNKLFNCK
jgi:hypothetical protein